MTALAEGVRTTLLLDPAGDRPLLPPRATAGADPALAAVIERAGLVGRGGAGFPTARKIAAVVAAGRRPSVVGNGAESEPLSRKDAVLMSTAPHLVLDGLVLAARAVGAVTADLCVHAGSPALPALAAALAARPGGDVAVSLREVPRRYVAGEASALARLAAGGPALPATRPPRLADRGVLVLNVETLAGIARAVRGGAAATLLVTVAGAVPVPGVAEVPVGSPLGAALARSGAGRGDVGAVLAGGYGGGWLDGRTAWDVPLTAPALRAAGADLGPGLMIVLPPYACGLGETARIARYLAGESAGQCGPCVFGLPAVAGALETTVRGSAGAPAALDAVRRWVATLPGRGACAHPDGAARMIASALRVFAGDVARHAGGRPCGRAA